MDRISSYNTPLVPHSNHVLVLHNPSLLHPSYHILHGTVGKTIQAIAMILDNRPDPKDKAQKAVWDLSDLRHDVDPKVRHLHESILSISYISSALY